MYAPFFVIGELIMIGVYSYLRGSGMMGMMDRPPLTRDEFMEIQERQRQGRHLQHRMMEHPERFVGMSITVITWFTCGFFLCF